MSGWGLEKRRTFHISNVPEAIKSNPALGNEDVEEVLRVIDRLEPGFSGPTAETGKSMKFWGNRRASESADHFQVYLLSLFWLPTRVSRVKKFFSFIPPKLYSSLPWWHYFMN